MSDDYQNFSSGLDSPAANGVAVTPSDTVDLTKTTRALWIGVAGTISVQMNGSAVSFAAAVGWMPLRVTRVNATGTTASSITAVW